MTVAEVKEALHHRFNNFEYELSESYIFQADWESDFFALSKSGYAYEVEIKLSRSDFRADFKKPKHELFANIGNPFHIQKRGEGSVWIGHTKNEKGEYNPEYASCTRIKIIDTSKVLCPNRFYFAVPTGLVSVQEVPRYAGLIYVDSRFSHQIVKEAPYLHRRKLDLTSILLSKFYYECLRQRQILQYHNLNKHGQKKTEEVSATTNGDGNQS